MKNIWFPAAMAGIALAGTVATTSPVHKSFEVDYAWADTVAYQPDAYKLNRKGSMEEIALSDSLLKAIGGNFSSDPSDTLTARDTIHAPDSLKYIDPFRYKYYVALLDSLTHQIVRDSLADQIKAWWKQEDTLHARSDSADRFKLDSLYRTDSAIRARTAFEKWYNSLSKEDRKKYDYKQKMNRKMHEMDSIKNAREDRQAIRDSILENTPRILETFALADSMQYKRVIAWTLDPDFQKMKVYEPDTTFNYWFNDYPFRRQDVNASWLGVAGSPVQNYNFFERKTYSAAEFYAPYESWSCTHETFKNYNTKTPHTELAYWGTLLGASKEKESDNIHIFTAQNITPALNFQILFDRWGGGGMLANENVKNKTFAIGANYLGKNYMGHLGFISNNIVQGENGGIIDNYWIRDTTVDTRDISTVMPSTASNTIRRKTLFLDQQLRIPLRFITDRFGRKNDTLSATAALMPADTLAEPEIIEEAPGSTAKKQPADSLNKDGTTAFIGHSSEWSTYQRTYVDATTAASTALFDSTFTYSPGASEDFFKVDHLDNKLFIRLQPWNSDAIVSKLNVGIGDKLRTYHDQYYDTTRTYNIHRENSIYAYAGVEGNFHHYFDWDAKGRVTFAGYETGDFEISANARFNFYPFRRARKSPVSVGAHFETSLQEPLWYQRRIFSNHYSWDNDFGKISTTRLRAALDIPHWKAHADVGYALLGNNIYYDTHSRAKQNAAAMSVLSASLQKEFVIANIFHLDNRVLLQTSSAPSIVPLPAAAFNLRWFAQFVVQKNAAKTENVMVMQLGVNGWYNTPWYAPGWNPALGVFHNQEKELYTSGPYFDVFMNIQWKRACIFVKLENAGMGWPMERADYFSAHHYINTDRELKIGIFWPFYIQPGKASTVQSAAGRGGGQAGSRTAGDARQMNRM